MYFLRIHLFLFFLGFLISFPSVSQPSATLQQEMKLLIHTLKNKHYSPKLIEDQLSKELFEELILELDPHKIYFRESDIKTIQGYRTSLDKEINGISWGFLPKITDLYKQRLQASEKLFNDILQQPFNYKSKDTVYFSIEPSFTFAKDEQDYLKRCTRWLKYQTLLRLVLSAPENKSDEEILSGEISAKQQIQIIESRKIKRILEHPMGFENYVASAFFNTVAASFDPHSAYMHKTEFENFQSELSREGFSFGIKLEETDAGEIAVHKLIPGGPAWKSNEIHKGDILIKLKWANKSEVDLTGTDVDEIETLFAESNTEVLQLTFRKINGMITSINLIKEKLEEDENVVKSYILSGEKKIGYISLPGFYTEWENFSGLGCANDVAREIIKQKAENIEGLILDLRFNGGGSLSEGLNLAGIFINEGPLMVMKMRDEKPVVMKDMNRGTVYDGPLVVMVNGMSASASEIVSSTLQDYNRAVIVGSPTYGKATGQILLPLDSTISINEVSNNVGSIFGVAKVTIEKLYRINGKSAQIKGVTPDVSLPDIYEGFDFREEANAHALPNDSISKKIYYSPFPPLPLNDLKRKNQERVKQEVQFEIINNLIDSYRNLMKDFEKFPLDISNLRSRNLALTKFGKEFENAGSRDSTILRVENLKDELEILKVDTYKNEMNVLIKQRSQSDIFIEESYHVISDLINLTNQ